MGLHLLAVLVTSLAAAAVPATPAEEPLAQEVHFSEGFTIKVPASWARYPQETVDAASEFMRKNMKKDAPEHCICGFQRDPWNGAISLPYMFVVFRRGRIAEDSLRDIKRVEAAVSRGIDTAKKAGSVTEAYASTPTYDEDAHILWTDISLRVGEGGQTKGLLATILTEDGAILVYLYSAADTFDKNKELFERIARAVVPDAPYKPRLADNLPTAEAVGNFVHIAEGAFTAAAVGAGLYFLLKRKKRQPPLDNNLLP